MKLTKVFKTLGPVDARSIWRDSLLQWMLVIPILPALVVRWGVPELTRWLQLEFAFDLTQYYPLMMSFFLLFIPMLVGIVIGFLLIDERDDRTLAALRVTPLRLTDYLAYRIALPLLLSVILTAICFPLAGLVEFPLLPLVFLSAMSGLEGPIAALVLAVFASNKVVGLALFKGFSIFFFAPLAVFFVDSNWQLLAGIMPTYWPVKAFWQLYLHQPDWPLYFIAGVLVHAGVLVLLLRKFKHLRLD
ncbi:MAG: hypothetical protein ABIA75_12385 [Candidatus Neomarinimicrobiota bacterium]